MDDPVGCESCPFTTTGECRRYNSADEDNFSQVGIFWNQVCGMTSSEICCSNFVLVSFQWIWYHKCLKRGCWAWLSCTTLSLKVLKPEERDRLVENIGNHLINTQKFIRDRAVKNFGQADPEFGRKLQAHLDSVSNVSKINVVLVGTV